MAGISKHSAIVVAAGGSRRMGFDKLTALLAGQPVMVHTIKAFLACPEIGQIIVVTTPERWALLQAAGLSEACEMVPGGAERHHSVWEGLTKCQGSLVAVHDAARPLISPEVIAATLAAAAQHGAAAAGRRITDTLKRVDANGIVTESLSRDGVWAMETPQTFRTALLQQAYELVLQQEATVTDEVSAVQLLGHPVHMVDAGHPNLKVTFPADLALAARLLQAHSS